MNELKGTEEQVAWAEEIRADFLERSKKELSDKKNRLSELQGQEDLNSRKQKILDKLPGQIAEYERLVIALSQVVDATGFIEARRLGVDSLAEKLALFDRCTNDEVIAERDERTKIEAPVGMSAWSLFSELFAEES